jgi:hypothetical protein
MLKKLFRPYAIIKEHKKKVDMISRTLAEFSLANNDLRSELLYNLDTIADLKAKLKEEKAKSKKLRLKLKNK